MLRRVTDDSAMRPDKIRARLEIIDGMLRSITEHDVIDKIVWDARDGEEARDRLIAPPFSFSPVQAAHILDVPLRRRTQEGREQLRREANELRQQLREQ
jgi:DNA gyrase subunit A